MNLGLKGESRTQGRSKNPGGIFCFQVFEQYPLERRWLHLNPLLTSPLLQDQMKQCALLLFPTCLTDFEADKKTCSCLLLALTKSASPPPITLSLGVPPASFYTTSSPQP